MIYTAHTVLLGLLNKGKMDCVA